MIHQRPLRQYLRSWGVKLQISEANWRRANQTSFALLYAAGAIFTKMRRGGSETISG
jgi:hypothetical protein